MQDFLRKNPMKFGRNWQGGNRWDVIGFFSSIFNSDSHFVQWSETVWGQCKEHSSNLWSLMKIGQVSCCYLFWYGVSQLFLWYVCTESYLREPHIWYKKAPVYLRQDYTNQQQFHNSWCNFSTAFPEKVTSNICWLFQANCVLSHQSYGINIMSFTSISISFGVTFQLHFQISLREKSPSSPAKRVHQHQIYEQIITPVYLHFHQFWCNFSIAFFRQGYANNLLLSQANLCTITPNLWKKHFTHQLAGFQ